jgi:hypothetical protein
LIEQKQKEIFEQFKKIEEDIVGHGVHNQYHELFTQLKTKSLFDLINSDTHTYLSSINIVMAWL